jgi:hypothetical protein
VVVVVVVDTAAAEPTTLEKRTSTSTFWARPDLDRDEGISPLRTALILGGVVGAETARC